MSAPTSLPPRRGFKSRSADLGPVSSRSRPWGFVTRHQISGWRFLIRRISNGVALRDTRMLTDPLRRQGRALSVGSLAGVVLLAGAFILSVLKPAGISGSHPILTERSSNALYVVVNDELHPVLNLASARLIIGKPADPNMVKAKEIDKFPLGNTLGIPDAPARMVQSGAIDARWMVCDASAGAQAGATVIFGDPVAGNGHAAPMTSGAAELATTDGGKTTWLIWGGKRSQIDLNNAAVSAAIGINADTAAAPPHQPRPAQPGSRIGADGGALRRQRRRSPTLCVAGAGKTRPAHRSGRGRQRRQPVALLRGHC